jgi:magnesium transporter
VLIIAPVKLKAWDAKSVPCNLILLESKHPPKVYGTPRLELPGLNEGERKSMLYFLKGIWIQLQETEEHMTEAHYYHIATNGTMTQVDNQESVLEALKGGGYIWLDYYQPKKEQLELLIEPLGLHPLSIEDCIDANQIPKMDDYPKNSFILFNAFHTSDGVLSVSEVDAFLGANFLVTVSSTNSLNLSLLNNLQRNVENESENVRHGPAFLLHILLDRVVDEKFLAIEALEEKLNEGEETILSKLDGFDPSDLMHLRRDLLAVRKSLFHEREILVKICRKDSPFIPENAIYLYRDIYDHLSKFFELTESYRDLVTSLMEMYLSMLNNQMTKAANDTNIIVRRLTLITTIFMPLTLLAGIGGMSEWSMMTGAQNWRIAYPAFLLAMAVLGVLNYLILKGWEKRRERKRRAGGVRKSISSN